MFKHYVKFNDPTRHKHSTETRARLNRTQIENLADSLLCFMEKVSYLNDSHLVASDLQSGQPVLCSVLVTFTMFIVNGISRSISENVGTVQIL